VRIHGGKDQAIERDARRHLSRLVRKDSLKRRDHAGIAGVLASRQRTGEARKYGTWPTKPSRPDMGAIALGIVVRTDL
jgi:hypothetical protein